MGIQRAISTLGGVIMLIDVAEEDWSSEMFFRVLMPSSSSSFCVMAVNEWRFGGNRWEVQDALVLHSCRALDTTSGPTGCSSRRANVYDWVLDILWFHTWSDLWMRLQQRKMVDQGILSELPYGLVWTLCVSVEI